MQAFVTEMDGRRLRSLLKTPIARLTPVAARLLSQKLERARVVPATAVPRTVATMNSRVVCRNRATGAECELSLVYPWASAPAAGCYSVLSWIGVELLGTVPGRRLFIGGNAWEVLTIAFQPEAERCFHL